MKKILKKFIYKNLKKIYKTYVMTLIFSVFILKY